MRTLSAPGLPLMLLFNPDLRKVAPQYLQIALHSFLNCSGRRVSLYKLFCNATNRGSNDHATFLTHCLKPVNAQILLDALSLNLLWAELLILPASFYTPPTYSKTYRHRDSQLDACLDELPTIMGLKRETCLSYFTSFAGGSHDAFCFANHHTTLVN